MGVFIHNLIKKEYEKRQMMSLERLNRKKSEVYAVIPRLKDMENEISLAGFRNARLLLTENADAAKVASELTAKIEELKKERSKLLAENGYPPDYLEQEYVCPLCKDTGILSGENTASAETCPCYKQQRIDLIYARSNLKFTGEECFANFNEEYYPDTPDESKYGIKNSPRKQIAEIKENCLSFIENFERTDTRDMLFCGPTGVGKTYMAACVAAELMSRGHTALYQSAPALFNAVYEYRWGQEKEERGENFLSYLTDVELLIIDDLGTESPSGARYAELLAILDGRAANNAVRPCRTIIATNIDIRKLYEYYDERIVSRIIGNFDIYRFAGEDIRRIKSGLA
jgi:DNA replication protein DnaC